MAKPQRKCIFCGDGKLSKEHVWPEWMQAYVPKGTSDTHIRRSYATSRSNPKIKGIIKDKSYQGNVSTIQLKVVCERTCNNGWMGKLEEACKPILIPLLVGDPTVLNQASQAILAAWIAMKVMVCEASDIADAATTHAERTYVMQNQRAPDTWQIWIARHKGRVWRNGYMRHAVTLGSRIEGKLTPFNNSYAKNTQTVTLGMGQLVIHVIATSYPKLHAALTYGAASRLTQIFPFKQAVFWPPGTALLDPEIEFLCTMLDRYLANLSWAAGPD
jgi:hypothetical protein